MARWSKISILFTLWVCFLSHGKADSTPVHPPNKAGEPYLQINGNTWLLGGEQGPLPIRLFIESKYKGSKARKKAISDWVWNEKTRELKAKLVLQDMQWHIRGLVSDGAIHVEVDVTGTQKRLIEYERFWLESPAKELMHLGRDYRWRRLTKKYVIDRWTPQRLHFKTAESGYQMAVKANSVWLENRKRQRIAIELDHHHNHPLKLYSKCFKRYKIQQKDAKQKRYAQPSNRPRQASFTLYFQETPLIEPLRYPMRMKSALAFTDHADRSSAKRLKALMLGSSASNNYNRLGFAGNGLSMSKSIFAKSAKGYDSQGDSEQYVAVLKEVQAANFQEIGLHSVSGEKDDIKTTEKGLVETLALQNNGLSRFWIDHQPSTNCEAISNEGSGFRKGSRKKYSIVNLLKKYRYDYVWAGFDRSRSKDGINLFDPRRPQNRSPVLYSHNGLDSSDRPIMIFSSLWRATPLASFLRAFDKKKLDRLSQDKGLHIAHTYLDAYDYGKHKRWRTLLKKEGKDYVIRAEAERLFADLSHRQRNREIWVAGIGAIGNHLQAMWKLEIQSKANGDIDIYNPSSQPVIGASFRIPKEIAPLGIKADAKALPKGNWSMGSEGLLFDINLGAGQSRTITVESKRRTVRKSQIRVSIQRRKSK